MSRKEALVPTTNRGFLHTGRARAGLAALLVAILLLPTVAFPAAIRADEHVHITMIPQNTLALETRHRYNQGYYAPNPATCHFRGTINMISFLSAANSSEVRYESYKHYYFVDEGSVLPGVWSIYADRTYAVGGSAVFGAPFYAGDYDYSNESIIPDYRTNANGTTVPLNATFEQVNHPGDSYPPDCALRDYQILTPPSPDWGTPISYFADVTPSGSVGLCGDG